MHVDAELIERVLEKHAIAAVAVEQHETERIEIDLIGLRREVVLALQEVTAVGDDLLATAAKLADRRSQLLELDLAGSIHVIGIDQQRANARIAGRCANRRGQIPEQCLGVPPPPPPPFWGAPQRAPGPLP